MTSGMNRRRRCGRRACNPQRGRFPVCSVPNDLELVAAAKQEDQSAFVELHRRHIDGVQATCRKILNVDDVKDVCQEIFLKAFRGIDSFKGDAEFKTWLTAIAKRECIRIKTDSERPTKGSCYLDPYFDIDEDGKEQEILHDPEWKEQFDDAERRVDLPKIVWSLEPVLPPKSRRVVKAVIGGATIQDVAKMLGVPLKTAESRFARLLQTIEKNILPK
jgi:RNA polymerase sigma-70 factor, ECF subfamily